MEWGRKAGMERAREGGEEMCESRRRSTATELENNLFCNIALLILTSLFLSSLLLSLLSPSLLLSPLLSSLLLSPLLSSSLLLLAKHLSASSDCYHGDTRPQTNPWHTHTRTHTQPFPKTHMHAHTRTHTHTHTSVFPLIMLSTESQTHNTLSYLNETVTFYINQGNVLNNNLVI